VMLQYRASIAVQHRSAGGLTRRRNAETMRTSNDGVQRLYPRIGDHDWRCFDSPSDGPRLTRMGKVGDVETAKIV